MSNLPTYGWNTIPTHLKTKAQLRREGLKPGKGARAVAYVKGEYQLFEVALAVPLQKRTLSRRLAQGRARRLQDYSPELEVAAAPLAAIFGVENWRVEKPRKNAETIECYSARDGYWFSWYLSLLPSNFGAPVEVSILNDPEDFEMRENIGAVWENGSWHITRFADDKRLHEWMARVLYCLGVEDPNALDRLDHALTAHEKLELRRGLAPEFWPASWINDLKTTTTSP